MWCNPHNIRFISTLVPEKLENSHPLRKHAFRTIVTDAWAGRKWLVHDSGMWNELTRKEDGSWFSCIGFSV